MSWIPLGLALALAGLWLIEQRRRRRAERETNVLLIELAERELSRLFREQSFMRDRVELIDTIQQLRERGGEVAVVFPPGYLTGGGDSLDIRA